MTPVESGKKVASGNLTKPPVNTAGDVPDVSLSNTGSLHEKSTFARASAAGVGVIWALGLGDVVAWATG
jgi:hypothetical protein